MKKLILCMFCSLSLCANPSQIVGHYLSKEDKRYQTFVEALHLLEQRGGKTLVETGTSRKGDKNLSGDGGSTLIFGEFAKENGALLYSVDIDAGALLKAEVACKKREIHDHVMFVCQDSIQFLADFPHKIDFIYLDSYDYDPANPDPSQKHHLRELLAAWPAITEDTIILIDDCRLKNGGKGRLAIQYLLKNGWKIHRKKYQTLLIKKE